MAGQIFGDIKIMNEALEKVIASLTESDEKSLSSMALKATEELGELAKAILPFESAYATNHRFVSSKKILEECVDTYLCLKSITYRLGYNTDDFNEMMKTKLEKWAELQSRELKVKGKIPYEIHITVATSEVEAFRLACASAGVKPIVLDLQNSVGGNVLMDVMTSSVFLGNNSGSFKEMKRISDAMKQFGLEVVREKIETVPWHPAAPSKSHINPKMPANCYFETHFAVICSEPDLQLLRKVAEQTNCHLSRNIFKSIDKDNFKIMLTYRKYDGVYEDFKDQVDEIYLKLGDNQFTVDKVITEFSVYDTKVSHDSGWIQK
jgi:hypothetical protein